MEVATAGSTMISAVQHLSKTLKFIKCRSGKEESHYLAGVSISKPGEKDYGART